LTNEELALVPIYTALGTPPIVTLRNTLAAVDPSVAADRVARWMADRARSTNEVSVVATGLSWVGGGTRSVEQTLIWLITAASDEILVTAYSLTSGSSRVMEALVVAVSTGVRCVFVINRLDEQRHDVRTSLSELVAQYPGRFRLYSFEDGASEGLHAKVMVVDRRVALVGSANLTFHGMTASHELGLLVRGPAAGAVAAAIDRLIASPEVRPL
jgi:phosphatidylserine/phosphatidylglycerophosphate/cardiolipin synthase-like enzyme